MAAAVSDDESVNAKAIRKQLEFYFSNANLSHDGFFRSEVQRTPDGSLGFDLLLSCNKLKALSVTKEHLLTAAERSKLLEVNESNAAIRRKVPFDFTPTSTDLIVLATGIPSLQPREGIDHEVENSGKQDLKQNTWTSDDKGFEDVTGMSYTSAIDWLKGRLKEYGRVKYVNMPRFRTSGAIRGFAFVEFASRSAAERAISALAPTESDLVRIQPSPSGSISGRKVAAAAATANIPEAGWVPKLAPYASTLSLEERLARQFVWRCCSRRSKQALTAYRRLFLAGYRMPNPLDVEYQLITMGVGSEEGKTMYGLTTASAQLRLLPYRDWLTWRPRFYSWLRAWTERMCKKTDQLNARAERKRHLSLFLNPPSTCLNGSSATAEIASEEVANAVEVVAAAIGKRSSVAALPGDFCCGTVVEVYWPLEEESQQLELRQQMRRVRAAIEETVLRPQRLLSSVAHFDTKTCLSLPPLEEGTSREVDSVTTGAHPTAADTSTTVRVFVRFREPAEAHTFARLLCGHSTGSSDGVAGCFAWGVVLEGQREQEYCAAIAAAKAGGTERRRRAQAAKRKRKGDVQQRQSVQQSQSQKSTAPAMVNNGLFRPTRIVFNDEDES